MKYKTVFPIILCLLLTGLLFSVSADDRKFVWTYEYQTMPRGSAEVEHYLTLTSPDGGSMAGKTSVEHAFELEIGMNDRFDFGLYQVFKQSPGASLKYTGFKARGRYRTGDINGDWLKPVIYVEYQGVPDFSSYKLEFKPIVGKTYGMWVTALNPKVELVGKADGSSEWEWGYTGGGAVLLHHLFGLGVEAQGSEKGHYVGPSISHGGDGLWISLGSGFALGDVDPGEPEVKIRLLIGVHVN